MNTSDDTMAAFPDANATSSKAAAAVKDSIDAANDAADKALYAAANQVDALRSDVTPKLKAGIDRVQVFVDQRVDMLRDTSELVREKARGTADQIVSYTKDEPVNALLAAAAVGAGLMLLFSLLVRSRD